MGWFSLREQRKNYTTNYLTEFHSDGYEGAQTDCAASIVFPEYDYEEITVPGKSGAVIASNKRWKNVEKTYSIFFNNRQTLDSTVYLLQLYAARGYVELRDSVEQDTYRLARIVAINMRGSFTSLRGGVIDVMISAMPQRWYEWGAVWTGYPENSSISFVWLSQNKVYFYWNPALPAAGVYYPSIRVTGYGRVRFMHTNQYSSSGYPYAEWTISQDAGSQIIIDGLNRKIVDNWGNDKTPLVDSIYTSGGWQSGEPWLEFNVTSVTGRSEICGVYGMDNTITGIEIMTRTWTL